MNKERNQITYAKVEKGQESFGYDLEDVDTLTAYTQEYGGQIDYDPLNPFGDELETSDQE